MQTMQSRFDWASIGGIGGRPTSLVGFFPTSSTIAAAMSSHVQPFRASEDLSSDRLLLGQAAGATATKGLDGSTVDSSTALMHDS